MGPIEVRPNPDLPLSGQIGASLSRLSAKLASLLFPCGVVAALFRDRVSREWFYLVVR